MTPREAFNSTTAPTAHQAGARGPVQLVWDALAVLGVDHDGVTVGHLVEHIDDPICGPVETHTALRSLLADGVIAASQQLGYENADKAATYRLLPPPVPAPTPTYPEALTYLHGSLPPNPELDTETQRALRVVVDYVPSLPTPPEPVTRMGLALPQDVACFNCGWEGRRPLIGATCLQVCPECCQYIRCESCDQPWADGHACLSTEAPEETK